MTCDELKGVPAYRPPAYVGGLPPLTINFPACWDDTTRHDDGDQWKKDDCQICNCTVSDAERECVSFLETDVSWYRLARSFVPEKYVSRYIASISFEWKDNVALNVPVSISPLLIYSNHTMAMSNIIGRIIEFVRTRITTKIQYEIKARLIIQNGEVSPSYSIVGPLTMMISNGYLPIKLSVPSGGRVVPNGFQK